YALAARRPAKNERGDVVVRARYIRREDYAAETPAGKNMPVDVLIDLGVDHYYADEAGAKELEQKARQHPIDVVLSVSGAGKPSIKAIVVDGERRDEKFF